VVTPSSSRKEATVDEFSLLVLKHLMKIWKRQANEIDITIMSI